VPKQGAKTDAAERGQSRACTKLCRAARRKTSEAQLKALKRNITELNNEPKQTINLFQKVEKEKKNEV
jgi:hypothetical protein